MVSQYNYITYTSMNNFNEIEEIGYQAFKDGSRGIDNPFSEIDESDNYCGWAFGWEYAKSELATVSSEQKCPKVNLIKNKSIDPDYGFDVEYDGEDVGEIVGIDYECGLLFKPSKGLREFEIMHIAVAMKFKEMELSKDGLLG